MKRTSYFNDLIVTYDNVFKPNLIGMLEKDIQNVPFKWGTKDNPENPPTGLQCFSFEDTNVWQILWLETNKLDELQGYRYKRSNLNFFSTNEELTYIPASTFVGVAATAVSIGATTNTLGVTTDILPSTVFAKVIDENQFQLFTRKEHIASGLAVTFTGSGSGNLHKLNMTKSLSKTIIGLDGVVQQPITFTTITHTFGIFDGGTYQPVLE